MNICRFFISSIAISALIQTTQAATNHFLVESTGGTLDYDVNGALDPNLPLVRGFVYTFEVDAPFHPFYLKTTPVTGGGSQYNNGISGTQGTTSGTILFDVPLNAPALLYYQCGSHGAMNGELNISDPPEVIITDLSAGTNITIKSTGYDEDLLNLNILTSTNLTTNTVWTSAAIQSNVHDSGTNTTTVSMPAGDAAFFQVQQGFF